MTRAKAKGRRGDSGLLKMGELAQRTDTPKETIHYYLRLGLLSPPVETSRNMAYYGERHVDELRSIARLQAESYLPLDKIKVLLDEERRASADRARDLAGDLFGRSARLALEPLDHAGLAQRSGLDLARVDEAVSAGLLGRPGGGFGWEDLRIAEVLAEADDDAVVERLHILDRHVRGMVDEELGHFFAMIAAGIEPDRGLELLHGGRHVIGRLITLSRARRMREALERVLAEVDDLARRVFVPSAPLPRARRQALGEPAVRARLESAHRASPDDLAARHALLRHLALQAEHAAVLEHARGLADAAFAAEACVELARYPEALAHLEPLRVGVPARDRPAIVDIVWAAALLARLRDLLGGPATASERAGPWAKLARLRGDVMRELLTGLTALARAGGRLDTLDDPLEAARARLLLGRVYVGTPSFLGLHPAAESALDVASASLEALAGGPHDPGLGVVERLRALAARDRAQLARPAPVAGGPEQKAPPRVETARRRRR